MSFYVYAIGHQTQGPVKIGFTNNLETRLRAIQTGNPEKLHLHHFLEFDSETNMRKAEKILHETLRHKRKKGEWFDILPSEAILELDYIMIKSF